MSANEKVIMNRPKSSIIVHHGDVIDMRDTEMVNTKDGSRYVRILLISETSNAQCQVFATAETAEGLTTGRITKILRVFHYPKKLRIGRMYNTDIIVEMENAEGEEPNLVARNSFMKPGKGDGATPNFEFRSTGNAEKEENSN